MKKQKLLNLCAILAAAALCFTGGLFAEPDEGFSIQTVEGSYTVENGTYIINAAGDYDISGSLFNGRLVIDAGSDAKVELNLHGAEIRCDYASPVSVLSADSVSLKACNGTDNRISDERETAGTEEYEERAAVFAKSSLTLCGKGSLEISSKCLSGIRSSENITVKNLSLQINAQNHGIKGVEGVTVASGSLIINTVKGDGIKTSDTEVGAKGKQHGDIVIEDGSILISAGDDGIHAEHDLTIGGGRIDVTNSQEGLEANRIFITGGEICVYAADDGVNACSGSNIPLIRISGGFLEAATPNGDTDAIDSNGSYEQTGGIVVVKGGASAGMMAGSVDVNGEIKVSGGTIIAFGGICSLPTDSCNVYISGGTGFEQGDYELCVNGMGIASLQLDSTYTSVWVCSDELKTGSECALMKNGSAVLTWQQEEGTMGEVPGMGAFGKFGRGGRGDFGNNGGFPGGHGGKERWEGSEWNNGMPSEGKNPGQPNGMMPPMGETPEPPEGMAPPVGERPEFPEGMRA